MLERVVSHLLIQLGKEVVFPSKTLKLCRQLVEVLLSKLKLLCEQLLLCVIDLQILQIDLKMLAHDWPRRAQGRVLAVALLLDVCLFCLQDLIIVRVIGINVRNLHLTRGFILVEFLHLGQLCLQDVDPLLPVVVCPDLLYASLSDLLALASVSEKCGVRHVDSANLLLKIIMLKLLDVLFQAPYSLFVVSLGNLIGTKPL